MTVSTEDPFVRVQNNSSQTIDFAFPCSAASELLVIIDDGTTATEYSGSDFSVTLNADQINDPGGTLDLGAVPDPANEVWIGSNIPALQTIDLRNATSFRAKVIEDWMDRQTMIIQQLQADFARALKIGRTTSGAEVAELIDTGTVAITLYMQGLLSTVGSAAALLAEIGALADAADAVTETHILDAAVTTSKIADANVTLAKLATGILSNDADGRSRMAAGFLSANSAGRSKMADGYVTEAKLDPAILAGFPSITMYTTATDATEDAGFDWPITANDDESASFAHGLGAVPDLVVLQLVCVGDTGGSSHGYTNGDILNLSVLGAHADKFGCDYDATRVIMKTGGSAISAGKITIKKKGLHNSFESNKEDWRLRAVCYKFGGML